MCTNDSSPPGTEHLPPKNQNSTLLDLVLSTGDQNCDLVFNENVRNKLDLLKAFYSNTSKRIST
jgi:hypothetical protein